jgi:pimeloyl-ACP methyl ester carboxylesterase
MFHKIILPMKTIPNFLCIFLTGAILLVGSCSSEPVTTATSADGVQIKFTNQGEGEVSILLVHGWTNDKTIWDLQIPALSEKYQVLAIDLAGHGESGNNREEWTMKAFGEDIAAVVDAADLKKVILVGFSMGGPAIVEAARLLPDEIKGLILVDAIQDPEATIPPPVMQFMDSVMMAMIQNINEENLVQYGFIRNDPESELEKVKMMVDRDQTGWHDMLRENMRWENEDCVAGLQTVDVPVVAINTDNQPTNVDNFKKYLSDFTFVPVSGSGHVMMWDITEEFNDILLDAIEKILSN